MKAYKLENGKSIEVEKSDSVVKSRFPNAKFYRQAEHMEIYEPKGNELIPKELLYEYVRIGNELYKRTYTNNYSYFVKSKEATLFDFMWLIGG